MSSSEKKALPQEKGSKLKKGYLIAYNTAQVVAWSLIFLKAILYITEKKSFDGLYKEVEYWLKIAQTAAILELFHSMFGLVRSSFFTTLPQVASRLFVLWVILDPLVMKDTSAKTTVGFPMLLFAWTVTEIIRYSYYASALVDNILYPLQWCRYTLFIMLYPLGVSGELISINSSLPLVIKTGKFSIAMPNSFNFGFDFVLFCYFLYVLYIPGFYYLYTYMLGQRSKVLGSKNKSE